jgi:hypothetical protein
LAVKTGANDGKQLLEIRAGQKDISITCAETGLGQQTIVARFAITIYP